MVWLSTITKVHSDITLTWKIILKNYFLFLHKNSSIYTSASVIHPRKTAIKHCIPLEIVVVSPICTMINIIASGWNHAQLMPSCMSLAVSRLLCWACEQRMDVKCMYSAADWGGGMSVVLRRGSTCPLSREVDGCIPRHGIISSCQSAATSRIVKRCCSC